MRRIITFIFLVSMLFGWGNTGHRVIGQIAEDGLSKKALKGVTAVLGHSDLAAVSNWADEIKSDDAWDKAYNWHWVTIPAGESYDPETSDGKAAVKIKEFIQVLKDGTATREEQEVALKFLVHLVGDIHQPLHVGNGTDRGGNDVKVTWFGKPSNLHRVWDREMIDGWNMSYTEWAHMLQRTRSPERLAELGKYDGIEAILINSQALHPSVYDIGDGKLSYHYSYVHKTELEDRLLTAGLHLAAILNDVYK